MRKASVGLRTSVAFLAVVFLFASAVAAQPAPVPAKQEAPFSNKDVIKLAKLGLGDEVVIAKIKQAPEVAFDLSTDGLVQLKQGGVSGPIIAAMLDRETPAHHSAPSPAPIDRGDASSSDVRILLDDKEVRLPSSTGDLSMTGFWPVVFTFLDYPGLHARTRTTNTRPTLIIRSEHDPKSYFYLAKLDVNEADENNRSLKIQQKASGFTATTRVIPAGRWHVEYEAVERVAGLWHITPTTDLQPGEYGVVVPGGILYEFGVD